MPNILRIASRLIQLVLLGTFFFSGIVLIVFHQKLFHLWYKITGNEGLFKRNIENTKKSFLVLLTFCISNFTSSSVIELNFKSEELRNKYVHVNKDSKVKLSLDPKAIIISNHQIYLDWFYLWFLAYLNDCADHIFIVMKNSLLKIPILSTGMKYYNFVFLNRNWRKDKEYMHKQFKKIKTLDSKHFWMLIFPEGTNMSHNNRRISQEYAEKNSLPKNQSVLLPRVKGLYVALKELSPENQKIIDFTVGYSGHLREEMAQDIFTLWKVFILGESPSKISIYVDQYDMTKEIPDLNFNESTKNVSEANEEKEMKFLESWINSVWQKKEVMMNTYYEKGEFDTKPKQRIDFPIRLHHYWEIVMVYLPSIILASSAFILYKIFV